MTSLSLVERQKSKNMLSMISLPGILSKLEPAKISLLTQLCKHFIIIDTHTLTISRIFRTTLQASPRSKVSQISQNKLFVQILTAGQATNQNHIVSLDYFTKIIIMFVFWTIGYGLFHKKISFFIHQFCWLELVSSYCSLM